MEARAGRGSVRESGASGSIGYEFIDLPLLQAIAVDAFPILAESELPPSSIDPEGDALAGRALPGGPAGPRRLTKTVGLEHVLKDARHPFACHPGLEAVPGTTITGLRACTYRATSTAGGNFP